MAAATLDRAVEVVEAYVPVRLKYLAELYSWLRAQLAARETDLFGGFSIYEVWGAFRGEAEQPYEERTIVLRLVLSLDEPGDAPEGRTKKELEAKIREIMRSIVRITKRQEEEVWVLRSPGRLHVWKKGG